MRPLAIIEPHAVLSESMQSSLHAAGFESEWFGTASAALAAMRKRVFALAILDLAIRDTDPFTVCREISRTVPLITVSHECEADACAHALECGADDCVKRATSGRELVARVHSVLRRADRGDPPDSLARSLSEMRVHAPDGIHNLTRGEAEVLGVLLQFAPSPIPIVRMATLLGAKRGTVESRIKSLRKKVGRHRLVSRGRLGYQLIDGA